MIPMIDCCRVEAVPKLQVFVGFTGPSFQSLVAGKLSTVLSLMFSIPLLLNLPVLKGEWRFG